MFQFNKLNFKQNICYFSSVASYLYTQGKVFGGCDEALQYIIKNSSKLGLRKVQKLQVSGGFHTKLMEPALKSFSKALNNTPIGETNVDVYSNASASIYPNNNEKLFKKLLIKQIVSPVKWEQTLQKIYSRPEGTNFPRTFDMGSRGTMKTILRMVKMVKQKNYVIFIKLMLNFCT